MTYLFFDNASTTPCCDAAADLVQRYSREDYGNPSSSHALGQRSAHAISEARKFFAQTFKVTPNQIIFTGSGSESDNLAIQGVALDAIAKKQSKPRVLASSIEHAAVRKTVQSLASLGVEVFTIPVDNQGQIIVEKLIELLTPNTVLVSIHRVNNIIGSLLPVEELAKITKERVPGAYFHTDAVQAFGRVDVPTAPSAVDLVSISAHKVSGPKGVGALVILNPGLLNDGLRPLIWGGDQEGGLRSGTQNAGLIAGFHAAAAKTLSEKDAYTAHVSKLHESLIQQLSKDSRVVINSPRVAGKYVPYIVNLSAPGFPGGVLAKMLEERNCLVSTGSACSSMKPEPDPVLTAMGLPNSVRSSAIRVSFSARNSLADVEVLAKAIIQSMDKIGELLGA